MIVRPDSDRTITMYLYLQKITAKQVAAIPCPALRPLDAEFFEHPDESIPGRPT